jgi:hypothetical protein
VVTQIIYVLEAVQSQHKYVGLEMAVQMDVSVLKVELVEELGVQLVVQFIVVR